MGSHSQIKPASVSTGVGIHVDRQGDRATLAAAGCFNLDHAAATAKAIREVERRLDGCNAIDLDLTQLVDIDGSGAVLLARLLGRLEQQGLSVSVLGRGNPEPARLIALYRAWPAAQPTKSPSGRMPALERLGHAGSELFQGALYGLGFLGRCAAALPKALASPGSVDWRSLPRLAQDIGADALLVTGAANLLVGQIIGFLGVSQLGRFGTISYVPELVVVAEFRELGPLVTAIVVAGRSGAGLASELATMKVSEEIDALRAMGFDPVRWLVVPRCLALAAILPLLTWTGNFLALLGGFMATEAITDMAPRAYLVATASAITAGNFFAGLVKTPFLALAIGLIACGQGLATRGGAAEVGSRTTNAVVLAILGVIVVNAVFTILYAALGI